MWIGREPDPHTQVWLVETKRLDHLVSFSSLNAVVKLGLDVQGLCARSRRTTVAQPHGTRQAPCGHPCATVAFRSLNSAGHRLFSLVSLASLTYCRQIVVRQLSYKIHFTAQKQNSRPLRKSYLVYHLLRATSKPSSSPTILRHR